MFLIPRSSLATRNPVSVVDVRKIRCPLCALIFSTSGVTDFTSPRETACTQIGLEPVSPVRGPDRSDNLCPMPARKAGVRIILKSAYGAKKTMNPAAKASSYAKWAVKVDKDSGGFSVTTVAFPDTYAKHPLTAGAQGVLVFTWFVTLTGCRKFLEDP